MRKFTIEDKRRGELAVRDLSDRAQALYNSWELLTVYAYQDGDGTWIYAYDDGCHVVAGLTLEALDEALQEMASLDLWSFKQLPTDDQIAYIESLDRWDDVDAEYYEAMCEDLGLDYSAYEDPDIMWQDITDRAKEA